MQTFGIASNIERMDLDSTEKGPIKAKTIFIIHLNSRACGEERKIETSQEEITIILNG